MKNEIKICKSIDTLSQFLGELLKQRINEIPDGCYFSIALSGGSTPKAVFRFLVQHFSQQISWEKILIFWGDERCVPPNDKESNYKMAKESLLDLVPIPKSNIFRIKGENDFKKEALEYENIIKQKIPLINGVPAFDFFMLGLGTEGHTASIFPNHLELFHSEKLFDIATHPETHQNRITATGKLINHARFTVFLVTGEAKSTIVANILNQKPGWEEFPASLVQPKNGKLLWLLDEKAASKLNNKIA